MSHIVKIQTEVKDAVAVQAACKRLGLAEAVEGSHRTYNKTVEGLAVQLPGWNYPAVFNTETGEAEFDNYNGRWGQQSKLDEFLQAYGVEKAKIEAKKLGHSVTEECLKDGTIRLRCKVNSFTGYGG